MKIEVNDIVKPLEKQISPYITACRDCCFSVWNKNQHGRQQIGCRFNKIEKYKEAEVNIYDRTEGDCTYKIIESLCTTARACTWPKYSDDIDQMMADARKEAIISVDCVIMCDDKLDGLAKTVESALNQTVPFKKILIGTTNNSPSEFILFAIEKIGGKCQWQVCQLNLETLQESADTSGYPLEHVKIDSVLSYCKSIYYAIFKQGEIILPKFVEALDIAFNDHLHRFMLVKGINPHNIVMQTQASSYMGHNSKLGIVYKVEQRLEEELADGTLSEKKRNLVTTIDKIMGYLS